MPAVPSHIAESGSVGDYIDSLTRLRYFGLQALYPGHGRVSLAPIDDINHAIANAQKLLENRQAGGPEIFYQRPWRLESAQAGFKS